MTNTQHNISDYPAAARALAPLLEAEAEASSKAGHATPAALDGLREAGMFGLMVPAELGGAELDLPTWCETLEELSYADGGLAWNVLANSTVAAIASRWLDSEAAKTIFADGPTPLAGQFTPRGTAVADPAGYRVSGKYSFGSGSHQSTWIGGAAMVLKNGATVPNALGAPTTIGYFVPRGNVEFAGGWDVMGLQSTGSYDYEVPEQVLEEGFTFFQHEPAKRGSGAASLTTDVLGVVGHGGWALGVGRRAIDEVLRSAKKPQNRATGANADREGFLHDISIHDASLQAARMLMLEVYTDLDATADRGDTLSPAQYAKCFQVNTYSTRVALNVVRECFEWAGVSAIRPSVIQRAYLDMSVAAMHLSQTRESFVGPGRLLVESAGTRA